MTHARTTLVAACAAALAACADAPAAASAPATIAAPATPSAGAAPLVATLSAAYGVTVVVLNRSPAAVTVSTQWLASAQLLLEVRDASGHVMPTMPPPTPTGETRTIAPGEKLTRTLTLDVFSPPLAPGDYTVRARGGDIASNVVNVHIAR